MALYATILLLVAADFDLFRVLIGRGSGSDRDISIVHQFSRSTPVVTNVRLAFPNFLKTACRQKIRMYVFARTPAFTKELFEVVVAVLFGFAQY